MVGKNGRLGAALCRALAEAYDVLALGRSELDLGKQIADQLKDLSFDLLINAAAATNVDWCELHEDDANQINARAVGELGRVCAERGSRPGRNWRAKKSSVLIANRRCGLCGRRREEPSPPGPLSQGGRGGERVLAPPSPQGRRCEASRGVGGCEASRGVGEGGVGGVKGGVIDNG